jgi:hypothetical protein
METVLERTEVSAVILLELLNLLVQTIHSVLDRIALVTVTLQLQALLVPEVPVIPRGLPHQTGVRVVSEDIDKDIKNCEIETNSI